jgi:hypothetical protein
VMHHGILGRNLPLLRGLFSDQVSVAAKLSCYRR